VSDSLRKGAAGQTPTTPIQQHQTPGYAKFRKSPLDPACFDMEEGLQYVAAEVITDVKGKRGVPAQAVYLVDPCQVGQTPLKTATIIGAGSIVTGNLPVLAMLHANPYWHALNKGTFGTTTISNDPETPLASSGVHFVSLANTPMAFILDLREMKSSISIVMTSTGTSTIVVESSTDNFAASDVTIDSIATAASTVKFYSPTTVGGTTAVSPLSFRYLKITVGAAGGGFVSTVDVAIK